MAVSSHIINPILVIAEQRGELSGLSLAAKESVNEPSVEQMSSIPSTHKIKVIGLTGKTFDSDEKTSETDDSPVKIDSEPTTFYVHHKFESTLKKEE